MAVYGDTPKTSFICNCTFSLARGEVDTLHAGASSAGTSFSALVRAQIRRVVEMATEDLEGVRSLALVDLPRDMRSSCAVRHSIAQNALLNGCSEVHGLSLPALLQAAARLALHDLRNHSNDAQDQQ